MSDKIQMMLSKQNLKKKIRQRPFNNDIFVLKKYKTEKP